MLEQLKNSKLHQKLIILQSPSQKHCMPILALPYNFNSNREIGETYIEAEVKQGREKLNQLLMVKMQSESAATDGARVGVRGNLENHLCQHPPKKA